MLGLNPFDGPLLPYGAPDNLCMDRAAPGPTKLSLAPHKLDVPRVEIVVSVLALQCSTQPRYKYALQEYLQRGGRRDSCNEIEPWSTCLCFNDCFYARNFLTTTFQWQKDRQLNGYRSHVTVSGLQKRLNRIDKRARS